MATTTVEVPTHALVIRGGHSLYCVECDYDVAILSAQGSFARADKKHEREVRALLRRDLLIRWDLQR